MTNTPLDTPVPRPSRSLIPGVLLIVFGVFFLAVNFVGVDFEDIWPVTLLVPAIAFFIMFARDRRQYGLLMPGTILVVLSVLFFTCQIRGWTLMDVLWPIFMLAPGLGFIMLYLFGRRDPGLLIPAGILIGLSAVFLLANLGFGHLWPAVLILVGVLLLVRRKSGGSPTPPGSEGPPSTGL